MAQADIQKRLTIVEATPEQDEVIATLARRNGLRVDPSAHRAEAGTILLSAMTESGELIGFVSARILLDEAEIFDLCVRETERRLGVGRSLLQNLMERLRAESVSQAFLEVRKSNQAARALYEGLGFSQVGARPRYYKDGEDAVLFRCCLPAAP